MEASSTWPPAGHPTEAHLTLETIHRFADPDYADLSLLMRTGERSGEVFDALLARGAIEIHASEVERRYAVASLATEGSLVIADTREQVAELNAAIRDHHREPAEASRDGHCVVSNAGERIGLGDRVATRRNNRDLDVANRDTWTVIALAEDGSLRVSGTRGERLLPPAYVAQPPRARLRHDRLRRPGRDRGPGPRAGGRFRPERPRPTWA